MTTIVRLVGDELSVEFPYSESAIARIKKLPSDVRRWDAGQKKWFIDPGVFDDLIELFPDIEAEVEVWERAYPVTDTRATAQDEGVAALMGTIRTNWDKWAANAERKQSRRQGAAR